MQSEQDQVKPAAYGTRKTRDVRRPSGAGLHGKARAGRPVKATSTLPTAPMSSPRTAAFASHSCGNGDLYVCTSITGSGLTESGTQEHEAYRMVPEKMFTGTTKTYGQKNRQGRRCRGSSNDPNGFYHGMTIKHGAEIFVLCGPPIRFTAETSPRIVRWYNRRGTDAANALLKCPWTGPRAKRRLDRFSRYERIFPGEDETRHCTACARTRTKGSEDPGHSNAHQGKLRICAIIRSTFSRPVLIKEWR